MPEPRHLSIELQHNPKIELFYDKDWTCHSCGEHVSLMVENQWNCMFCLLYKSGKDNLTMFGWQITKAATGQINASRIVSANPT